MGGGTVFAEEGGALHLYRIVSGRPGAAENDRQRRYVKSSSATLSISMS